MENNVYWSIILGLFSSILGAIIGGLYSLKAVDKEYKNKREEEKKERRFNSETIMKSIHNEIEAIHKRYMESIGHKIASLKENEPLLQYYPIKNDFFIFYKTNASEIAKLYDNELRKKIINTYFVAKALIDTLKINNTFFQQYEEAEKIYFDSNMLFLTNSDNLKSIEEVKRQRVDNYIKRLEEYSSNLKSIHNEFDKEVQSLLDSLHQYGVTHDKYI